MGGYVGGQVGRWAECPSNERVMREAGKEGRKEAALLLGLMVVRYTYLPTCMYLPSVLQWALLTRRYIVGSALSTEQKGRRGEARRGEKVERMAEGEPGIQYLPSQSHRVSQVTRASTLQ